MQARGDDGVAELVFLQRRTDVDGATVAAEVTGVLSEDIRQRVARPYTYLHEAYIYDEQAMELADDSGAVQHVYAVWKKPNPTPQALKRSGGPLSFDPELDRALLEPHDTASREGLLKVILWPRGFPDWNIPLAPDETSTDSATYAALVEAREKAFEDRVLEFESLSQPLVDHVVRQGGRVVDEGPMTGYLTVEASRGTIASLRSRGDLVRADLWRKLPAVPGVALGQMRDATRTNVKAFIDAGYDGGQSNPGRHNHGRIAQRNLQPTPRAHLSRPVTQEAVLALALLCLSCRSENELGTSPNELTGQSGSTEANPTEPSECEFDFRDPTCTYCVDEIVRDGRIEAWNGECASEALNNALHTVCLSLDKGREGHSARVVDRGTGLLVQVAGSVTNEGAIVGRELCPGITYAVDGSTVSSQGGAPEYCDCYNARPVNGEEPVLDAQTP